MACLQIIFTDASQAVGTSPLRCTSQTLKKSTYLLVVGGISSHEPTDKSPILWESGCYLFMTSQKMLNKDYAANCGDLYIYGLWNTILLPVLKQESLIKQYFVLFLNNFFKRFFFWHHKFEHYIAVNECK